MRISYFYCVFTMFIVGFGCGADTSDSGGTHYGEQAFDGGIQLETDAGTGMQATSIESTWARRHVMAGIADLPAFGPKTNLTVTLSRVSVLRTTDGLISREQTCDVQILRPDVTEIETVIPRAFTASIAMIDRPLYVNEDRWVFGHAVQVQGAHLVDPDGDELPSDASDPRVFDQDQDGLPGVTVLIEGILDGSVQVVQRTHTRMVGTRVSGVLEGTLEWESEESIISASNPILENNVALTPSPHPEESDFIAVEVDPNMTCVEISNSADTLFDQ